MDAVVGEGVEVGVGRVELPPILGKLTIVPPDGTANAAGLVANVVGIATGCVTTGATGAV